MFSDDWQTGGKAMTGKSLPLAMAGIGERLRVTAIHAGRSAEMRLTELGLPVGREITVLQRQSRGPMVIAAGDARVALGFGLSSKVFVTPLDGDQRKKDF